jgi:phenylacetate-CoA ligase
MTDLDSRIRDLIAHAYANAPTFRKIMDDAGVKAEAVQTAADLQKIPVTPKDKLVEFQQADPPFGGLLTVDPTTLPRIYISPGPIYDPQPTREDGESQLAPFKAAGFGKGDRVLNTFMYHLTPAGLLLDEALRALGATVIPTGPGNTELQIMMMTALKANGFIGQPSFLGIILDKAAEMGLPKEAITIKKAMFSAEPYFPPQRARFEGEYGIDTVNAYATADLGFLAYTRPLEEGFRVMDTVHIELVDRDSGQVVEDGTAGEVVVTTFNKGYPLIRFGTGDLAVFIVSDAGERTMRLVGRVGDAIKVRGMFLHPNQVIAAMGRVPQVKHAQVVISRPFNDNQDYVLVRVELHPEQPLTNVREAVSSYIQAMSRLRVDEVKIVDAGVIDPSQRMVRDDRKWE